jgi:hypothetical protein
MSKTEHSSTIKRRFSVDSSNSSMKNRSKTSKLTEQLLETKKRNRDMHIHFKGKIPPSDLCLADFTCTLIKDNFPRLGKLYLTCQNICFHSYIKDTKEVIHVSEIRKIKQTGLVAHGLKVHLEGHDVDFIHFFFRERAERCIGEIVEAFETFELGSRDSGCDLGNWTGNQCGQTNVPKSIQRKISRILEPHLDDNHFVKSQDSEDDDSGYSFYSCIMMVAFFAFLVNLYCAVKASLIYKLVI